MSLSPNYGDPFGDGTPQPADCHACGRPVDPETCQLSSKGDDVYICAECVADDAGEPEPCAICHQPHTGKSVICAACWLPWTNLNRQVNR